LLSALQTGGQTIWSILRLINIDIITEEPYLDLLGVFGVLGMIYLAVKKEYFIPIMLLVIYLVQPRSAHTVGNIPLALAAGVFITEALLPVFLQLGTANTNRGIKVLLFLLVPYLLINSIYQGFMLSQNHVSKGEQAAMQWIKDHTPRESKFLVITAESDPMCDSSGEWFPSLTKRTSLSTLQGQEWLPKNKFGELLGHRASIQSCINKGVECLNRETGYFGTDYSYIYISTHTPTINCRPSDSSLLTPSGLIASLEGMQGYSIAYRSEQVVLFQKK
jgi:hypothetical protein